MHEEEASSSADIDPLQKPSFTLAARQREAHPADVNCVRWNPADPTLLASAGDDGSVRLWRYRRRGAGVQNAHALSSRQNETGAVADSGSLGLA